MGLEVNEMLNAEYFKDFKVLAGHGGLNKQIQGIAILDAPDGYTWTKGRELVVSSGYVFKMNPGLLETYINDERFREVSGIAIKVDRYLKEIDQEILDKCDECNVPFIYIPDEPSWMDIMNHLNVLVMNKKIKQFKIEGISTRTITDVPYQSRKINKILYQIEKEMNFPAMVYDVQNDKPYFSSQKFKTISAELNLTDFWKPSFKHTTEILCDNLGITRFRFIDKKYKAPYSWIEIPIVVDNTVKAYFVVLEAEELIDYFDQFALRIGFLLIQSIYEQILVSQSLRDRSFKQFIEDMVSEKLIEAANIEERARELNLDINAKYIVVIAEDEQGKVITQKGKETIERRFQSSFGELEARIAFPGNASYLLLIPFDEKTTKEANIKKIKRAANQFDNSLKNDLPKINLRVGISDIPTPITDILKSYKRASKALDMGKVIFEDLDFITYSELGPFAWMEIKPDEINNMKSDVAGLLTHENSCELIKTLDTYLKTNMNYSVTAKELFIHINTVRKRIEYIYQLIDIDLSDPMSRLKLQILLKII